MLRFYLHTVIIWFIIYICISYIFSEDFKKNQEEIRKELGTTKKKMGVIKTTFFYIVVSFVPIIRAIFLIGKLMIILDVDKTIKMIKERKENGNKDNK